MLRFLAVLGLLATSLPLLAAPGGATDKAAELPAAEAQGFAEALVPVAGEIHRAYVRPVTLHSLLFAALAGLYEEARLPVPEDLRAELEKAVKPPPEVKDPRQFVPVSPEAVAFAAKVRLRLGNPEALQGTNALRVAIQAMARSLDPYCAVVGGDELRRSIGENLNRGVGITLLPNGGTGPLLVGKVVPGGSAQRKGIRPGDRITHINGKSVEGKDSLVASLLLHGDEAAIDPHPVELTLRRAGRKAPFKLALEARYFKPELVLGNRRNRDESWNYYADPQRKLAHVRLGALEQGLSDELRDVLMRLQDDGMKGLVLDLRWGPGGFLNEAVLISQLFVPKGVIARIQSRGQAAEQVYSPDERRYLGNFPVVVLVNGETSGGSELVAAALQDNDRGVVFGQRTFGKASVQTMLGLPIPNAGLKLTSGNFIRPSGKALHRFPDSKRTDDWGVQPDPKHALPITADLGRELRDWWKQLSIRPGSSDDPLALDDPENDPQLMAALKALAAKIEKHKK